MLWKVITFILGLFVLGLVVNLFTGFLAIAVGWQIVSIILAVILMFVLWNMTHIVAQ